MTLRRMPLIESTTQASEALLLAPEWEGLLRRSTVTGPFMTWPWIGSWLETVGSTADLELVTARDPGTGLLVGIAPFYVADAVRAGIRLKELRFIGAGVAAPDHLDLLIEDGADPGLATALWQAVLSRRRWHLMHLNGVVADGHLAAVTLRRRTDTAVKLPCPYLSLEGGWDEVSKRLDSRLRKNLERYGRKLDRDAEVTERMVATPEDLDVTFDHLVRFHQSVRTSHGDAGVFATDQIQRLLRLAAHRFLAAGRLRLWRLDADGAPIAVIMCVRAADSVAFYTTGYDQAWSKYGPGRRIMARAVRAAIEEGATEFDFLRGDEPYKRSWGTVVRDDLVIRRGSTPRGRLVATVGRIRAAVRGALRRDG